HAPFSALRELPKAVAKEAVKIVDDRARSMLAGEALIEALGSRLLKRHVAVMARSQPCTFQSGPRVAVEISGGGVHSIVLPGSGVAGLSAGLRKGSALHVAARDPIGEIDRRLALTGEDGNGDARTAK